MKLRDLFKKKEKVVHIEDEIDAAATTEEALDITAKFVLGEYIRLYDSICNNHKDAKRIIKNQDDPLFSHSGKVLLDTAKMSMQLKIAILVNGKDTIEYTNQHRGTNFSDGFSLINDYLKRNNLNMEDATKMRDESIRNIPTMEFIKETSDDVEEFIYPRALKMTGLDSQKKVVDECVDYLTKKYDLYFGEE